jgi:hypothetical protein
MLSPYARQNFVDHRLYDHTSILRFIEWRFLGAPAHGPGTVTDGWFLTTRDRNANNIGWSLRPDSPDPDFDVSAPPEPPATHSPPCPSGLVATAAPPTNDFERGVHEGFYERMGYRVVDRLPW